MKIDGTTFSPIMSSTKGQGETPIHTGTGAPAPAPIHVPQVVNVNFPGERQFIDSIEKSNGDFKVLNTNLSFSIHEKTKQISVKIINSDTKEVIKEIPSEKILDMVAAMLERTGLFMDKRG